MELVYDWVYLGKQSFKARQPLMSAAKLGICFLHIVLEPTCFRAALNILFELSQNTHTHTITHISEVLRCASFDTMNFECYEGFSHILNDYAADVGGRG